jgi:hypothetical protein
MKRILVVAGAAALAGFAQMTQATDFTLTVPVNIANLPPEIDRFYVCCYVSTRLAGGTNVTPYVCAPRTPVSGGVINSEFTIGLNATPGVDPATGTAYMCYAEFLGTVRGTPVTVGDMSAGAIRLPLTSGSLGVSGAVSR